MGAAIGLEPLRAGIGEYFPLLVLLFIWWVSSRRAGKKRLAQEGQGPARASRQSGASEAPNNADEVTPLNVLRQMLFGGMEMPPLQSQPPEAPLATDLGDGYQEVTGWKAVSPLSPAAADKGLPVAPLRVEEWQPPVRRVSAPAAAQPKAKRTSLVLARTSRRELQRAVVWSEVLAPPVGLRDSYKINIPVGATALLHRASPPTIKRDIRKFQIPRQID